MKKLLKRGTDGLRNTVLHGGSRTWHQIDDLWGRQGSFGSEGTLSRTLGRGLQQGMGKEFLGRNPAGRKGRSLDLRRWVVCPWAGDLGG